MSVRWTAKLGCILGAALGIIPCAAYARYLPHAAAVHEEALKRQAASPALPTWTHKYSKGAKSYQWVMVGSDPAAGSATTTLPVYVIPMVFTFANGKVFDPTMPGQKYADTPLGVLTSSPVFKSFPFKVGTVKVGTTQYADAFQRANFWSLVSTSAPNYHVLLNPTVMPALSIKLPWSTKYKVEAGPHGVKIGIVTDSLLDEQMRAYMTAHPEITTDGLALFVTYDVSTKADCGYHSNVGKQTYAYAMFDDNQVCGTIDGDVDTITHEVAEWVDDPFGNNVTPDKTRILEVGDPATAYGFYVASSTFTFTLQDLMFHDWFDCALPSSSVNGWFDFQNKFKKNDC